MNRPTFAVNQQDRVQPRDEREEGKAEINKQLVSQQQAQLLLR